MEPGLGEESADVAQPPDQRGDPGQGPPLILGPAPGGGALLQRCPQPRQLGAGQPAPAATGPCRRQRGLAARPPAPPPLAGRFGTDPQPVLRLHRAGILREQLRGLQPHHLAAGPSLSGQTATIPGTSWLPALELPPARITPTRRT